MLKSHSLGILSAPETDADLSAAEIVVSAGRGIEKGGLQFIVGINRDPRPAIFQMTDIALLEDLLTLSCC